MSTLTIHNNSISTNWLASASRENNRTNPDRSSTQEQPKVEAAWLPLGFLASGRMPTIREVKDWLGEKPRHFFETLKPITAGGSALTGFGSIIGLFGGNEIIGGGLAAFGILTFIVGALSGPNLESNTLEIGLHNNHSTIEEGPNTMVISSTGSIEPVFHTSNQFQFSIDSFSHTNNTVFVSPNGTLASVEIVQPELEPSLEELSTAPAIDVIIEQPLSQPDNELSRLIDVLRYKRKPKDVSERSFLNTRKNAGTQLKERILSNSLKPWLEEKKVLAQLIKRITEPDNNELRIHITNALVEILQKSNPVNDKRRIDQIVDGLMAAIAKCSEDLENHGNQAFQEEIGVILRGTDHSIIKEILASLEGDKGTE